MFDSAILTWICVMLAVIPLVLLTYWIDNLLRLILGQELPWGRLARRYPQLHEVSGPVVRGVSARIGQVHRRYFMTLVLTPEGFGLRPALSMNLLEKSLFVPWDRVGSLQHLRMYGRQRLSLRLLDDPDLTLYFNRNNEGLVIQAAALLGIRVQDGPDLRPGAAPMPPGPAPARPATSITPGVLAAEIPRPGRVTRPVVGTSTRNATEPAFWWLVRGKERPRRYTRTQLKELAASGGIVPGDHVWWSGQHDTVPAHRLGWLQLPVAERQAEPEAPPSAEERDEIRRTNPFTAHLQQPPTSPDGYFLQRYLCNLRPLGVWFVLLLLGYYAATGWRYPREALAATFVIVCLVFPGLALLGKWGVRGKYLKGYLTWYVMLSVSLLLLMPVCHGHLFWTQGIDHPQFGALQVFRQSRTHFLIFVAILGLAYTQQSYLEDFEKWKPSGYLGFMVTIAFFVGCALPFFHIMENWVPTDIRSLSFTAPRFPSLVDVVTLAETRARNDKIRARSSVARDTQVVLIQLGPFVTQDKVWPAAAWPAQQSLISRLADMHERWDQLGYSRGPDASGWAAPELQRVWPCGTALDQIDELVRARIDLHMGGQEHDFVVGYRDAVQKCQTVVDAL